MKFILYLIAIFLTIILLSFSVFVCAANIGSATCWNKEGDTVYKGQVKDLIYAVDIPSVIWLRDTSNNDVFIQNLECLVIMHKVKKHVTNTRKN